LAAPAYASQPDIGQLQISCREITMRFRLLGQTGLYVSELCLGTMTYGGGGGIWESIGKLQQPAVDEQVAAAVDAGINFIDTANVYSLGMSGQGMNSQFPRAVAATLSPEHDMRFLEPFLG